MFTQFRVSNNKLEQSVDLGLTWTVASNYIAAWFRFTGTTGSSQADNVGKIQISRDNGATWSDLSGEFTNSLHIKGYVATVGALPSTAVQGDIYGVGPTYDPSDTEHTNPIYQLYVKDSTGWINNGRFTSIAAGVVQELGNSETAVISQRKITEVVTSIQNAVEELQQVVDYDMVTPTMIDGYYLSGTSSVYNPHNSFYYSEPFLVKANSVVKIKAKGQKTVVNILSSTTTPSAPTPAYKEVVRCTDSNYKWYEAKITEDTYLIACGEKGYDILIVVTPISNIEDDINDLSNRIDTLESNSNSAKEVMSLAVTPLTLEWIIKIRMLEVMLKLWQL